MRTRRGVIGWLAAFFRAINRFIPWHKLPAWPFPRLSLRLWNLPALRADLRERNLYDTARLPVQPEPPGYTPPLNPVGIPLVNPFRPVEPFHPDFLRYRTADGGYNDLQNPTMGRTGARYARNFPFAESCPRPGFEHERPTPRQVSEELMLRDTFQPATTLNLLAAAWIQFEVHDWARHMTDLRPQHRIHVPLDAADPWPQRTSRDTMAIDRTLPDHTRPDPQSLPRGCPAGPPSFLAEGSFWWDGSQIYGSDRDWQHVLRSHVDGKLRLTPDNRLLDLAQVPDPRLAGLAGLDLTGFPGGWWAGLSVLHTLFAREHNAICDMLKAKHPAWAWDDERLFQTARLINAALMAKIHTVEWTPAILGMPVLKIGMEANWWGVLGEQFRKKLGRLSDSEELSGIPGSLLDHHGVPFAFTEEFVSVYRLHPLIPDEFRFHSLTVSEFSPRMNYVPHGTNQPQTVVVSTFDHIQGLNTRRAIDAIGMENVVYSFGLAHPGAITLHNYPHFLRNYRAPEQPDRLLDVATIDILRDRERGVPRYNRFRELLRMPRMRSFDHLNARWAREIADLYDNKIDEVDTMVGLFAEEFPEGFGFSDTAFRIFILMASRRLKSDRFFTTDYRPEIYTKAGLDWISENGFESVLLRHYPALAPAVKGLANPFRPWRSVHERTVT
ncbi:peroxidase family protein [Nitrospira sp. Kam-Ns4a]